MRLASLHVVVVALLVSAGGCINAPLRPTTLQVGRSLNSDNSVGALTTSQAHRHIYASVRRATRGRTSPRDSFGGRVVSEPKKEVRYRATPQPSSIWVSGGFPW